MSALFSASAASMDIVLQHAALYGLAAFLFGYLGKKLLDLWIDRMGRQSAMDQHAADALRLATKERKPPYVGFDAPEVAPEDEPSWEGKAPHDSGVRHLFGLREPSVVLGGNPARFDLTGLVPSSGVLLTETPPETTAETSGRHALTESMPAVVASVSGEDGAG